MSLKKIVIALAIAGAGAPSFGADYTIDPEHTYPSLEMDHMGLSTWRGKFNKTSGKATYDPKAKTGSVDITIDAASIDWGHDVMNEHAVLADWLNVEKHPTITYKGSLVFKGNKPVAIDGKLTLRGVTKPVRLKLNRFKCINHPFFRKEVCGADAEATVNRADFGMDKYIQSKKDGLITLRIQAEAIKDGPATVELTQ